MNRATLALLTLTLAAVPGRADDLFTQKIAPLLRAKCQGCHGDEPTLRGGLDVRSRAGLLKGGSGGPAVVAGDAAKSPLYQSVLRTGELVMPPKESARLTVAEAAALKAWIDGGAPWPGAVAGKTLDPVDAWAYFPVTRPVPPAGGGASPVDAFVDAALTAREIKPAPLADRATLIRRASFDLTGLPPTPEQVDAFVRDASPDAFARLLDTLLASPRYGERMAQHWLDVVRYADTGGFANDFERPAAWRYRDFVIRSFNADKPYDRFVLEQIAGDELGAESSEGRVAVGFLRMGPWEHTGMSVAAQTRQMWLDDVTNSVGVTFLGQGLNCCRCHDHKFDPLPTEDYYRIQALFAGTHFAEAPAPFLVEENTADFAETRADVQRQFARPLKPLTEGMDVGTLGMISGKRNQYQRLAQQRCDPACFSVQNGKSQTVAILKGGALEAPGAVVRPGFLSAVAVRDALEPPTAEQGRRLALARWIASPHNPLTARVIVNRAWQMHFGTGLVATPNNFGKMGGRPSHPELLDWLAAWFVDNGWSLKRLHRLLMLSAVYQRSGQHPAWERLRQLDSGNRLLAYFPPRRLSAEEVRDALLTVTGELNLTAGGPGVFPEINADVARQPRHIMGGVAPVYQPSPRPGQRNRRTIYTFRARGLADPMQEVLNRPGTELSCERRDETTVAPQAFALFNSDYVHARALALANRVANTAATTEDRVERAFRLALLRVPSAAERRRCVAHVEHLLAHHRAHPPAVVPRPEVVRRQMVAERTGEPFVWEEALDSAHYQPDLKPWDVSPEVRALAELCLVLLNTNEFIYVY